MNKTDVFFILIAFSGVFFHWLKKYARNELSCSFLDYLVSYPKHTVLTMMTLVSALFTLQTSGVFAELTPQNIGLVFMAGFTADSTLNKGE
jgi:hypothetical protein